MTIVLYEAQESGNLKLIEAREEATPGLAVDAYLDDNPRSRHREFIFLETEDGDAGVFGSIEVTDDAPVQPRRKMKISSVPEEEDEAPAPTKTTRRRSAPKPAPAAETPKPKPARRAAPKAAPKPKPARRAAPKAAPKAKPAAKKAAPKPKAAAAKPKPAAKKGGKSPFTRNPKSDD